MVIENLAIAVAALSDPAPRHVTAFVIGLVVSSVFILLCYIGRELVTTEEIVDYGQFKEDEDPWLDEYGPRPEGFPKPRIAAKNPPPANS